MQDRLGFICGEYLARKAYVDNRIWVIDGDLADSEGAENFVEKHPDKFINAGIAEQNMVSVAAGLAAVGLRPWVFSFAAFLCYRAYDQIRVSIAQTNMPVTLVGSHAGACCGKNGKTHIAINDIALMSSLPRMNIWAPSCPREIVIAVDNILFNNEPTYLRLPRDPMPELPQGEGIARWIGKPSKIAIVSYGYSTQWAYFAQNILRDKNFEIGIIHFCKLWPLNPEDVASLFQGVEKAFVIEDHYELHGFVSCLKYIGITIPLMSLAWPDNWFGQSGDTEDIRQYFALSSQQIAQQIIEQTSV